jgi:predicted NAD-dependent protein-ADP-ribosyltransferase YbiA (DUF1768 family)
MEVTMTKPEPKILFNERGLKPGTPFQHNQWPEIATHSDSQVCGYFGKYFFLSNFKKARVFLDGIEYSCVEIAYQAAKVAPDQRLFFSSCKALEAVDYIRNNFVVGPRWHARKVEVMTSLLRHKFDRNINPGLFQKLQDTGDKYLEETNYWEDVFWGVYKTSKVEVGVGENNLGKIQMRIRAENN